MYGPFFGGTVTVEVDLCKHPMASAVFALNGYELCTFELGEAAQKVGIPGLKYGYKKVYEAGVYATGKASVSLDKITISLGVDACGECAGVGYCASEYECLTYCDGKTHPYDFTDLIAATFEAGLCDGSPSERSSDMTYDAWKRSTRAPRRLPTPVPTTAVPTTPAPTLLMEDIFLAVQGPLELDVKRIQAAIAQEVNDFPKMATISLQWGSVAGLTKPCRREAGSVWEMVLKVTTFAADIRRHFDGDAQGGGGWSDEFTCRAGRH